MRGWFWRNRGRGPVTVTLRTRGDYRELRRSNDTRSRAPADLGGRGSFLRLCNPKRVRDDLQALLRGSGGGRRRFDLRPERLGPHDRRR